MSIERNKKDFEEALNKVQDAIPVLEDSIKSDLLEPLNKVVDEYEGHFKSDIEELINRVDELESVIKSQS